MDDIQKTLAGDHGGTGGRKIESQLTAIGAFKSRCDLALVRCAASFAERWIDESHLPPATGANKPFGGRSPGVAAKLADFRITQRQSGIDPVFDAGRQWNHKDQPRVLHAGPKKKQCLRRARVSVRHAWG